MTIFALNYLLRLKKKREQKHFERAIRKNGNVMMLDYCLDMSRQNLPFEALGQKLREVYEVVSPQQLPKAFVTTLDSINAQAA